MMKAFSVKYIYVIFSCAIIFFSCKPKADEKQLKKVTELENIIYNIEGNLSIDEQEISSRQDSIILMLNYLQTQKHDSGDVETHGALTRYFGIQKNYETYLSQYPVLVFDLEKNKNAVEKLRKELEEGNISADEFEKNYQELKSGLQEIDKKAADLAYNTFAVQGDYRRSHEKVKALYERVKARN